MSPLLYQGHGLCFDGFDLSKLSTTKTPFYLYAPNQIKSNINLLKENLNKGRPISVHYAVKANSNIHLLKIIKNEGIKAEIVSIGEWERCLHAGFFPKDIAFSGVGKRTSELEEVIANNIGQITVESLEELERIQTIAQRLSKKAPLLIRINPEIDSKTHPKIATANKDSKFGISISEIPACIEKIKQSSHVDFLGLGLHVGSQIQDIHVYDEAYTFLEKTRILFQEQGLTCERIDLGGGFYTGSDKSFDLKGYLDEVYKKFSSFKGQLLIEPGRFVVANAGIFISRVEYIKRTKDYTFVILDAGMNDLLRPALYGAIHEIFPVIKRPCEEKTLVHFVGPVCESSDKFLSAHVDYSLEPGDLIAMNYCGAYGSVMAGTYNARPLIREMLLENNNIRCIRKPISVKEQISWEI